MSIYLSPGDTAFAGENKRFGARITYYLIPSERKPEERTEQTVETERTAVMSRMSQMRGQLPPGMMDQAFRRTPTRVSITILDSEGKFVSRISGTEDMGINRVYWDLRETEPPAPGEQEQREERISMMPFGRGGGVSVLPGTYTAKIKYDDQEVSQAFEVKTDPRFQVNLDVLKANFEKAKEAQGLSRFVQRASRQIQQTQRALQTIKDNSRMSRNPKNANIIKAVEALEKKIKELSETLNPTPPRQGIADRSTGLSSQVMSAVSGLSGAGIEPLSQAALVKYEKVKTLVNDFAIRFNAFYQKDIEEFKKMLQEAGFSLFGPFVPLKIE